MNHLFLYATNMDVLKKMLHIFIEECKHISALHFNRVILIEVNNGFWDIWG